jgi:hypothetical protein
VWDLANEKAIHQSIVRISELENEADTLYASALADLFRAKDRNPIEVMKWKEIYDSLERTLDVAEDVANVLESVVIKHG